MNIQAETLGSQGIYIEKKRRVCSLWSSVSPQSMRVLAGAPAAFLKKLYCLSPGSPSSQHVTPYYAKSASYGVFCMKFYAIFRYIITKATHFNGRY
jgi:hypothetical protein